MYTNPQNFTVSGLRTWSTNDGGGYQGSLCINGKAVIKFHNDGNGGMMDIVPVGAVGTKALDDLRAHCASLPNDAEFGFDINDEMFIGSLVDQYELDKRHAAAIKRKQKDHVVFRLPTDGPYEFRFVKLLKGEVQRPAGIAHIMKKYPNAVIL